MKGIKFPKADKTIRKFTKNKKADLAVKVTPSGADRHPRFGSMSGSEPARTISRLRDLLSEVASEALKALKRGQRSYAIRLLKVLRRRSAKARPTQGQGSANIPGERRDRDRTSCQAEPESDTLSPGQRSANARPEPGQTSLSARRWC